MYELFNSAAFREATLQFERASRLLTEDDGLEERFRLPQRTLVVSCPVRMDGSRRMSLRGSPGDTRRRYSGSSTRTRTYPRPTSGLARR